MSAAAYRVSDVRAAEGILLAELPDGALMARAATGLAIECAGVLREIRGRVTGSRVVLLIGTGDNGGDALYAGAQLARRGAAVVAVLLGPRWHAAGAAALMAAGGRLEPADPVAHTSLIGDADLVLDGIVGIGGSGALREPAAEFALAAAASDAAVVAVDLPSGIDADTGAVADADAVITADVTVTFGCLKPGQLVAPAVTHVGELRLIDIGLNAILDSEPHSCEPALIVVDEEDAATWLPEPGASDDKYSRGVAGVVAGSAPYPGAAVLCTGSARLGGAGMVRYAGGAPEQVIAHWPEVVIALDGPAAAGRAQAWAVGPGAGTDDDAQQRLTDVLALDVPVLVDADGLTLLAADEGLREAIRARRQRGAVTVLTPHAGEFARLGFELESGGAADRAGAVRVAAAQLGAVVLLKGASTIVASPSGATFVNVISDPALATAGSGDVLSGLSVSMLAAGQARAQGINASLSEDAAAEITASAALVHGLAGVIAAADGRPVTAESVLAALPGAIAALRSGEFADE